MGPRYARTRWTGPGMMACWCDPRNFFIIFVDAIFTTLFEPLFTKVFDVTDASEMILACAARATPINSLAT